MVRRGVVLLLVLVVVALVCAVGAMRLLPGRTGPILAVTPVPAIPSLLVADESAGRLLAISQFGNTLGPNGLTAQPNGSLQILDAATGTLLRTVAVGEWPSVAAADARTGQAFVLSAGVPGAAQTAASPTDSNYLSMVDPVRGVILHTVALHPAPPGAGNRSSVHAPGAGAAVSAFVSGAFGAANAVIVDSTRRLVYVESSDLLDGNGQGPGVWLIVLDADRAAVLRRLRLPTSAGAIGFDELQGHLLVSGYRGNDLAIVDARSLQVLHDTPLGTNARQIAVDGQTRRAFLVSEGATPNGPATITTLDLTSGKALRSATIAPNPTQALTDPATSRIFALSVGPLGATPRSSTVTMLDARTGGIMRSIQVSPYALGAAADAARGRIYVTGMGSDPARGQGNLSQIDARTGTLERMIDLGGAPISIAVDTRRGHIFAARVGNEAAPVDPWDRLLHRVRSLLGRPATTPTPVPHSLAPGGSVVTLEGAQ